MKLSYMALEERSDRKRSRQHEFTIVQRLRLWQLRTAEDASFRLSLLVSRLRRVKLPKRSALDSGVTLVEGWAGRQASYCRRRATIVESLPFRRRLYVLTIC